MLVVWEKVACAVLLNSWYSSGSPSSSQPPLIASTRAFRFASSPSHFWLIMCLFAYVYRSGPRRKRAGTLRSQASTVLAQQFRAAPSAASPLTSLALFFSSFAAYLSFSLALSSMTAVHTDVRVRAHTHTHGRENKKARNDVTPTTFTSRAADGYTPCIAVIIFEMLSLYLIFNYSTS